MEILIAVNLLCIKQFRQKLASNFGLEEKDEAAKWHTELRKLESSVKPEKQR